MAAGKLTSLKVKNLTAPGRYGDGGNLWLQVRDAEHRSWLFRYVGAGRQRQMGLGPYPDVSLADARDAARDCRAAVRKGLDPINDRRATKVAARNASDAMTFRQVADKYLAAHGPAWRNAKHRWQWAQTLDVACGTIGKLPVSVIETADVMCVLEPLWSEKTETASRLRGRIESVLDYAAAHGWRTGDNPARWRGHLAKLLPPPSKIARVEHHPALDWRAITAFMRDLSTDDSVPALALRFAILTAARSGEVLGAKWSEIDRHAAVWTVPAARMKAGIEHRVPLSDAATAVLSAVAALSDGRPDSLVFPGTRRGKPLSGEAMIKVLRRTGRDGLSVHGMRSSFRDWAAETGHPADIAEAALAHTLGDKTVAAYQRGDLLERRRKLMADWAAFCCGADPFGIPKGAKW